MWWQRKPSKSLFVFVFCFFVVVVVVVVVFFVVVFFFFCFLFFYLRPMSYYLDNPNRTYSITNSIVRER